MVGLTISSYQILEILGEGGMGVVYRAKDVRLERFVALKFLKPEGITADRKNRFLQEAKSISALNHQNIVHIYDIGQFEGMDYIAMEYVDGVTLQEFLATERLTVHQALGFAIQIADAMAAAHEAGIVHRDLKPGNILISGRKRVKVVDFGLAKLVDPDVSQDGISASSETQVAITRPVYTATGVIVGSLSYMSPEQAQGQAVDARSDIFAFGLVLYEMLAGRPAFTGPKFEVLAAIVTQEPKKLSEVCPEIVPELEWIVVRCLRKDPDRRFQRMMEVRAALEDLRAEASSSGSMKAISTSTLTAAALVPLTPVPHRKARYTWLIGGNIAAILCVVAAGFWLIQRDKTNQPEMPEVVRLTTESGLNKDPVIAQDGKFLAYASDRAGNGDLDIWVRQIGASNAVQLTHNAANDDEPDFSPDGTEVAFHSNRDGGGLYLVSTLGGPERKIADGGRNPKFSPDGSRIAYWSGPQQPFPLRATHTQMFVVDLSTLATHRLRQDFVAALYPIWAPDGKRILFRGEQKVDDDDSTDEWWTTPLDGGPPTMFGNLITQVTAPHLWAWRKNTIYLTDFNTIPAQVSEIGINPLTLQPVGTARRLTSSTSNENSASVSKDGLLVFASLTENTNLYTLAFQSATGQVKGSPVQLTHDEGENLAGSLSSDGQRLAFASSKTGSQEIWTREMKTGQEHELTFGGTRPRVEPLISPNGELVAWRENMVKDPTVLITPFSGGSSRETCGGCGSPDAWTPDNSALLYHTGRMLGNRSVGLFHVATGEHLSYLSDARVGFVACSITPDGKWILFKLFHAKSDYTVYAAPFSVAHAPERSSWIELFSSPEGASDPTWSDNGRMVVFMSLRDGSNCIWGLRVDQTTKRPMGAPFAIHHFHSPSLELVMPAFGSNQIIVSLLETSGSVWMMKSP